MNEVEEEYEPWELMIGAIDYDNFQNSSRLEELL